MFVLASLIFIIPGCSSNKEGSSTGSPNIIFIMADDLGYGDLGSYGQEIIKTPNLNMLAEEGTRFTRFYSGNTVCAPSRCALMTGMHMGHAYIRGNTNTPIRSTDITIAEILQDAGYVNGMFGKWGLGNAGTSGDPSIKGFDAFTGYTDQVEAHYYYGDSIDKIIEGRTEKVAVSPGEYTYDIAIRDALDFIRKNKDNKFFAYLPLRLPHAELLAPENDMQLYLDENGQSIFDETSFPGDGHYAAQAFPNAAYAAMVSKMDHDIGKIIELLIELEIAENSILFFTSDNGATNGLGHTTEYFASNGPLRGQKGTLYEGGIRVPMIVWGPERVSAGRVRDHKWTLWDISPTLAELAGEPAPADIDGISMVNLILNQGKAIEHDHLYWEYGTPWLTLYVQTVIKGKWKLVKLNRNIESVKYELYNLDDDIDESENLANSFPQKVIELNELIVQSHSQSVLSEFDYSYLPDARPIPPDQLYSATGENGGLTGEYFAGTDFIRAIKKQTDPLIWFQWGHDAKDGLPADQFSVRWTGELLAEQTGVYNFYTASDDGVRLWLDNLLIIDDWNIHGVEINHGTISLEAGKKYMIRVEYFEGTGGAEMKLGWISPGLSQD